MKIKTSELTGAALDMAVSMVVENSRRFPIWLDGKPMSYASYSTDWTQGGPIIEMERITIWAFDDVTWRAQIDTATEPIEAPTPLIAAMRCYVASKVGDEIDLLEGIL